MGVFKEFREFAVKGNVVDMAVGIIIGGAFTTIVKSMVDDILMPPIAVLGKNPASSSFSNFYINLSKTPYNSLAEATAAGAPVIRYGLFLQNVVSFLIVAFATFLLVKGINALKRTEEAKVAAPTPAPSPATPEDILLLRQIRDSLKK